MVDQGSMWRVTVKPDWCKKCGLCVRLCPKGVLKGPGIPEIVDEKSCIGCLMCEMHCPDFAITVERRGDK